MSFTHVLDVGANPFDGGKPPYLPMLNAGLCRVTGFEPHHQAFLALQLRRGPNELYLPYAVGDGSSHILKVCRACGMTSLLEPDPTTLGVFPSLEPSGEVIERVPVETRRLDDIGEIEHLDMLKIDVQGSELSVFQNGQAKLAEAVAIQTEVSFITLYQNQPSFGEVDLELRRHGFIPHGFTETSRRPIGNFVVGDGAIPRSNQLAEADIVYVRDFTHLVRLGVSVCGVVGGKARVRDWKLGTIPESFPDVAEPPSNLTEGTVSALQGPNRHAPF